MKNFDKVMGDDIMIAIGVDGDFVHVWDPPRGVRTCRRASLRKVGECTLEERHAVRDALEAHAKDAHGDPEDLAATLLDDLVVDDDAPGDDLYSWTEHRRWWRCA